jgi:hypothetical protein
LEKHAPFVHLDYDCGSLIGMPAIQEQISTEAPFVYHHFALLKYVACEWDGDPIFKVLLAFGDRSKKSKTPILAYLTSIAPESIAPETPS